MNLNFFSLFIDIFIFNLGYCYWGISLVMSKKNQKEIEESCFYVLCFYVLCFVFIKKIKVLEFVRLDEIFLLVIRILFELSMLLYLN